MGFAECGRQQMIKVYCRAESWAFQNSFISSLMLTLAHDVALHNLCFKTYCIFEVCWHLLQTPIDPIESTIIQP